MFLPDLLNVHRLCKAFPGVQALADVDFLVNAGEIHALLGENGAGKSTLIKLLTGVYPFDRGTITFNGAAIRPRSPREAETLGISTVYQEVNLIPQLSVAENILLGRQPRRFGMVNWRETNRRAEAALAKLGIDIDVTAPLSSYSLAIGQMAAIARALDVDAKLLILDEPTSSLDEREVAELFRVMRDLASRGLAIIFVTHFLDQVYAVCDRITVLRNGRRVGTHNTTDLPRLALIGAMLGRSVEEVTKEESKPHALLRSDAAPVLAARDLGARGSVTGIDLAVAHGEVVGLAGLLGSGRTETARLLFGIDRAETGVIDVNGAQATIHSPRQAIRLGLGFCSENRKAEGIIPHLSVRENLILAMQASRGVLRRLPPRQQQELCEHYIRALSIKTPSPQTPIGNLSGGNQQKVLLARWLAMQPKVMILDEPTRGIDVGAKAEIEKLIASLREQGMAVIFISSELEELVRNCQRVVVLRDRRKVGELTGDDIEVHRIMHTIAAGES